MSFCKYCGKELLDNEAHDCPKKPKIIRAVSKLFDKSGIEDPFNNKVEMYERGQKVTPDNIALEDGEIPVKQYNEGILRSIFRFQRSEGRLQITNKRVLFRATGYSPMGKTTYQHAFALDKIDGIEIRKDHRFRVPNFLFVLALGLVSMVYMLMLNGAGFLESSVQRNTLEMGIGGQILASVICFGLGIGSVIYFFCKKKKFFRKMLFTYIAIISISTLTSIIGSTTPEHFLEKAFVGLILPFGYILGYLLPILFYISVFFFVITPNLMIEIKTSSGSPAIQIKHKYISFIWHKSEEFSGFDEILPWEDTDLAIKEVATIIDDIKTLGDFAIEKWQSN